MTVSIARTKVLYTGDGANTQWDIPFPFLNKDDLKVYVVEESGNTQLLAQDYQVDDTLGVLTYPLQTNGVAPLSSTQKLLIIRQTPLLQHTSFQAQDNLDPDILEKGYDKAMLIAQELSERLDRSIAFPQESVSSQTDAQAYLNTLNTTAQQAQQAATAAQAAASSAAADAVAQINGHTDEAVGAEAAARVQADAVLESSKLSKIQAAETYLTQANAQSTYLTKSTAQSDYLTQSQAQSDYLTQSDAQSNYLAKTDAQSTYLTQANAQSTYLAQSDAAATYATQTALSTALAGKQNTLTSAQQAAVDSGVTATTVAQVQTNKQNIAALDAELDEDRPWQKPSDWIDIRSGALPNSVYFLVGHSADFSAYPIFAVQVTVSNSGTYDVFVDGIKQATTASGTVTELDWQTLALTSGYDVTYPTALRTHIVRVTPSVYSNAITAIAQDGTSSATTGTLWIHFALENRVRIINLLAMENKYSSPLVEAITSINDELLIATGQSGTAPSPGNGLYGVHSLSLKYLSLLTGEGSEYLCYGYWSFTGCEKLRKLRLKNMTFNTASSSLKGCSSLEKIECDNAYLQMGAMTTSLVNLYKLEKLPTFKYIPNPSDADYKKIFFLSNASSLKDTNLDLSVMNEAIRIGVYGSSSYRMDGLKALTVSNEAPFDSTTSPQLDVSYTGLDRAALVNLFNSMPYNVGYEVVGTPTITDGVVSGFVNQTNYLNASQSLKVSDFKDSEIQFRVATSTAFPVLWMYQNKVVVNIFPSDATLRVRIANASLYSFQLPNSFNTTDFFYYKLMFDSNYTCRFYFGTTAENMTLIEEHSFEVTEESGNYPLRIGGENNNWTLGTVFNGSIDLNNTYIKINGVPWFRGTAAMTKTCSVVGCTGTADLTAADKAIATDKGWSLTVA